MLTYDKQYINGEWIEGHGDSILEDRNPYTNELLYKYRSASKKDVNEAYKAAKAAQKDWASKSPGERNAYLEKLLEAFKNNEAEMINISIEEGGSAPNKVGFEVNTTYNIIKEAMALTHHSEGKILPSDIPHKKNLIIREPKGVIGVIAPWNVPFVLALRSVVPAVTLGNTVLLKPASDTPATALFIAKMFEEAGFPKGVFNAIVGRGSEIGDSITDNPIPDMISFTGSTEVGKHIGEISGKNIKDVSLELGGNNVEVILKDADIAKAVKASIFGTFFNAGQVCMRTNRIIVVEDIYDEFLEAFVEATKQVVAGDPSKEDTYYGPIINESQRDKILGYIQATINEGATVSLEGKTEGNVITPWIISDVTNDMTMAQNEVFGPAVSVIKAKDEKEALEIANDTDLGLSGSVFTEDLYHGIKVAKQIGSGMVHLNYQPINDEPHVMFGGEKQSGIGRFNGKWVADKFTRERWISIQEEARF